MISSVLPPSRPATTLPAPPPPSLDSLRAAARERLDAALIPVSFSAPCADCGRPRLSVVETRCPDCESEESS